VQYAVLNAEKWTGISIFRIEPKLDAGPVLGMVHTRIARETSGELERRLSELAPPLVLRVIDELERGVAQGVPQDSALVTRAPRMNKAMGLVDWSQPLARIDCHVRAMQPWPMAFTFLHQPGRPPLRLLVLDVTAAVPGPALEYRLQPASGSTRTANTPPQAEACTPTGQPTPGATGSASARPGTILSTEGGRLVVQTGDGPAVIVRLQPAGKRAMTAVEFMNGHHVQVGQRLGAETVEG
jgi:methionyl-tRNA formyltransferase